MAATRNNARNGSRAATRGGGRQGPRTASPESRRAQLIEATIRTIASKGISGSTMADVAAEAGLSQGIINLHFKSKDRLFVETLRFLADDYRQAWEKALGSAGDAPADRLRALVTLDFSATVADRRKLAVWFAFWGEVGSRPTYRRLCAQRDRDDQAVLVELCNALIAEGGYAEVDAADTAATISAIGEGLWLDMLIIPREVTRKSATRIALRYLATVFPEHFDPPGASTPGD